MRISLTIVRCHRGEERGCDWGEANVGPIKLTESEQKLWEQIYFAGHLGPGDDEKIRASIEPAHELARSLIERKAIPDVRWRYFADPRLNVGHGKSHKQIFEQNGTRGHAILRHPHFHKYLRYFVLGPDLPQKTIAAFSTLVRHCKPVTSGDQEAFCQLARCEIRVQRLERRAAAEEFFKLALEVGLDDGMSRVVRDSVMKTKGA